MQTMAIMSDTALAQSQGRAWQGLFLIVPARSRILTRTCTLTMEMMDRSMLVTAMPSLTPPGSIREEVRYHVNMLR